MITLDTSGLFARLNRRDPDHGRAREVLLEDSGPYLVPADILAEVACLLECRLGVGVLEQFVLDLESGAFTLECDEEDLASHPRARAAVRLPAVRFADANVISCAERRGGGVLILDRRDLDVVAGEEMITPCPERGRTPEVRFTRSGRKLLPHYRAYRMVMF